MDCGYLTINTKTSPEEKAVLVVCPLKPENGSFSMSLFIMWTKMGTTSDLP